MLAPSPKGVRTGAVFLTPFLDPYLFDQGVGVAELFGRYEERDFTTAALHMLGLPDRKPRAKAKHY